MAEMKKVDGREISDEQLGTPSQMAMRDAVKGLPEDSLSMAWRSGLNERLLSESKRYQRRARWFVALRPAVGLAMAGALATVFFMRANPTERVANPRPMASNVSLEAQLLTSHEQSEQFADVAGTGLRPMETAYVSHTVPTVSVDWQDSDFDSL